MARCLWTIMAALVCVLGRAGTAGAQSALAVGLAATVGDGWQIQGADVGIVGPLGAGPLGHWSAVARVGSFVDQRAFFQGQQGIVGGLALAARTRPTRLAEIGNDPNVMWLTLDVTIEATGYVAANSPRQQWDHGARWVSAAILPALRMGEQGGTQYTLLIGPTAFLGPASEVRVFFGVRAEWPLASRGRAP